MKKMTLKENWSRTKEVLWAQFRQGLHELGAAFYGPGTVAQPPEYGMIGTKTPGEVADGLQGKERHESSTPNQQEPSPLDKYTPVQQPSASPMQHEQPEATKDAPAREVQEIERE